MKESIKKFVNETHPLANKKAMVAGEKYRITVLTDRLLRLEYQEAGRFVDQPTQTVLNRQFPEVEYEVVTNQDGLEIITKELHLYYDTKDFSPQGLRITLEKGYGVYGSTWIYGETVRTLKGTARTLDNADGEIPLGEGLLSREGYALLDDSKTAILDQEGWILPRVEGGKDLYFFGYGHDYMACLSDFYKLCGQTPLLPRYTLGNWWSRFYPYHQQEYIDLMDRFAKEEVPMAVSVIDMDWHMTQIPEKYGSGWTGYTWNRDYFPNPKEFLKDLHERGLRTTLNLHPADGVKGHEENYLPMAKAMGVDYEKEERIPFDVTDEKFMDCYFTYLHHPLEEEGVDFWWVDWQQGEVTRTPGIDPLWMLNHLHYLDHGRDEKRPLTFSRYAGVGSHRYPIGFSGDTVSSWASLDFQPYFTATASNVGYSWWSHDIGGHQRGEKDDELVTRWIQYGVFSPIMRLHSTANPFYGKEPWNYGMHAAAVMKQFMQLRHRLIPYLYTMNYLTAESGIPLIQPMYYQWDREEAYGVPNQYLFGSQMMVCPITKPMENKLGIASVVAWIPDGLYYDFFTHNIYAGGRRQELYRTLDRIPVLVKAGGIIPMAGDYMESHRKNPAELEIQVFCGGDGSFTMVEDDCLEQAKILRRCDSIFNYSHGSSMVFTMALEVFGAEAFSSIIPENRSYQLRFVGAKKPLAVKLTGQKKDFGQIIRELSCDEYHYDEQKKELLVCIEDNALEAFELTIETGEAGICQQDILPQLYALLNQMQISYELKEKIYRIVERENGLSHQLQALHALDLPKSLYGAVLELLTLYEA